jgi:hypothetical protein
MKAPLSGIVAKGYKTVKHDWQPTERMIPGGVLKLFACTSCVPAHLKAYDLEIRRPNALQGEIEYEQRSKH